MMTLCWREVVRFRRQRSRLVGAFVQPLVFWLLLGGGLRASFRPPGTPPGTSYVEYVYPGIIAMVLLFTAIFSTISVVEDRREGFLQGVLVAPVARSSIVLGQALGGTTLAVAQGILFLVLAPAAGLSLTVGSVLSVVPVMFLVSFGLTSLGLVIAWRLDSTQGFHAIMNLILLPMWVLSGAFFPTTGVPAWLGWTMQLNPLTYGMAALRRSLYLGNPTAAGAVPGMASALGITLVFCILAFVAAADAARRSAA
ncbi:MAG: ABC transporter permease [candidate division NC10 bacterium]|nr:ABC transporter permease [candidate division NC10 bacterium]